MQKRIVSRSEDDTRELARVILRTHVDQVTEKPVVLMLYGDLGSGKTVFAKEIGKMLGLDDVVSPSYTIYDEYRVKGHDVSYFYHVDLYRVDDVSEFSQLGFDELVRPGNVVVIEWSEKSEPIRELLNKAIVVEVRFEHVDENTRNIHVIMPEAGSQVNQDKEKI